MLQRHSCSEVYLLTPNIELDVDDKLTLQTIKYLEVFKLRQVARSIELVKKLAKEMKGLFGKHLNAKNYNSIMGIFLKTGLIRVQFEQKCPMDVNLKMAMAYYNSGATKEENSPFLGMSIVEIQKFFQRIYGNNVNRYPLSFKSFRSYNLERFVSKLKTTLIPYYTEKAEDSYLATHKGLFFLGPDTADSRLHKRALEHAIKQKANPKGPI